MRRAAALVTALALSADLISAPAIAGPPYLTDDPEPVELGHWEVYAASQWFVTRAAADGTAPHVEVNYGALPEVQLHVIVPAALAVSSGEPTRYGLGDVELGVKYRFVDEGERRPQVGTFPLLELPTGSAAHGLGFGKVQALLPIWIQKSFGRWTTYGGGGVRLASGEHDAVAGWLVQRGVGKIASLGTEAFVTVPLGHGAAEIRVDLGLVFDFSELHHLLLSAGPAFGAEAGAQGYCAYQLTI